MLKDLAAYENRTAQEVAGEWLEERGNLPETQGLREVAKQANQRSSL